METKSYLISKLPIELHRRIKIYCAKTGDSMGDFMIAALEEKMHNCDDGKSDDD